MIAISRSVRFIAPPPPHRTCEYCSCSLDAPPASAGIRWPARCRRSQEGRPVQAVPHLCRPVSGAEGGSQRILQATLDIAEDAVDLPLAQGTIGRLEEQRQGQALFPRPNLLAAIDIEDRDLAQQLGAALAHDTQHL